MHLLLLLPHVWPSSRDSRLSVAGVHRVLLLLLRPRIRRIRVWEAWLWRAVLRLLIPCGVVLLMVSRLMSDMLLVGCHVLLVLHLLLLLMLMILRIRLLLREPGCSGSWVAISLRLEHQCKLGATSQTRLGTAGQDNHLCD